MHLEWRRNVEQALTNLFSSSVGKCFMEDVFAILIFIQ